MHGVLMAKETVTFTSTSHYAEYRPIGWVPGAIHEMQWRHWIEYKTRRHVGGILRSDWNCINL